MTHDDELLQRIKDEVAREKGYDNYWNLLLRDKQDAFSVVVPIAKRYAEEMLKREREQAVAREREIVLAWENWKARNGWSLRPNFVRCGAGWKVNPPDPTIIFYVNSHPYRELIHSKLYDLFEQQGTVCDCPEEQRIHLPDGEEDECSICGRKFS